MPVSEAEKWGDRGEGVRYHLAEGWMMREVQGLCLVRLSATEERPDKEKVRVAMNFAFSADQCREIAQGLIALAEDIDALKGNP